MADGSPRFPFGTDFTSVSIKDGLQLNQSFYNTQPWLCRLRQTPPFSIMHNLRKYTTSEFLRWEKAADRVTFFLCGSEPLSLCAGLFPFGARPCLAPTSSPRLYVTPFRFSRSPGTSAPDTTTRSRCCPARARRRSAPRHSPTARPPRRSRSFHRRVGGWAASPAPGKR